MIYEPKYDEVEFFQSRVIESLEDLKKFRCYHLKPNGFRVI